MEHREWRKTAGRLQPRDKLGTGGQQADSNLRGEVVVDVNSKSQIKVAKVSDSVFLFADT